MPKRVKKVRWVVSETGTTMEGWIDVPKCAIRYSIVDDTVYFPSTEDLPAEILKEVELMRKKIQPNISLLTKKGKEK